MVVLTRGDFPLLAMFDSTKNPGYRNLTIDAKSLIVNWTRNEWYESST